MGRTEASQGLAPPSFRRDARAKKAKATLNKVIPTLLSTHPRAKRGADSSELIVEPRAWKGPSPEITNARAKPLTSSTDSTKQGPKLVLQVADTLTVAHALLRTQPAGRLDLSNREARVAVLNMASPLSPGGGFVNGANSQEESLCMRTTLLPSLKDEFYRLPEIGAVYTPDVLVFRDARGEDLEKRQRWFVDCISASMLRMPDTEIDEDTAHGRYTNDKDRALVLQKMRAVLRICQAKGVKKVVLGAWGCGAYGNPVGEVATAWKKVLLPGKSNKETWHGIDTVVFAIKDRGLADGFEQAFGDGIVRDEVAAGPVEEQVEDSPEALAVKELEEKVRELEIRLDHTKNSQVKDGLSNILLGLKSQLVELGASSEEALEPPDSDEESSEEEEGFPSIERQPQ